MADESKKPDLPSVHPALDKAVPGTRQLAGYVGPPEPQGSGVLRLYATLDDLDQFIEFHGSDVVHFEQTPEGRTLLWLKPEATITTVSRQRTRVEDLPSARKKLVLRTDTVRALNLGVADAANSGICAYSAATFVPGGCGAQGTLAICAISGCVCTDRLDCGTVSDGTIGCTASLPGC